MKWIDYRDKLGVGFSDSEKAKMLKNNIVTFISYGIENENYSRNDYYCFCLMTGIEYKERHSPTGDLANFFIYNSLSVPQIISYYTAFVNSQNDIDSNSRDTLYSWLYTFLDELNIPYDVFRDDDGEFVFPKGVPELDHALVSEVFEWLHEYPKSEKAWRNALKSYAGAENGKASDIAASFRKALETFFKEFFKNDKSLEKNMPYYCDYLKDHSVPAEIRNTFDKLLDLYEKFMNHYAKHDDGTSDSLIEYIMYQTGNTMRLLITLKGTDEKNTVRS